MLEMSLCCKLSRHPLLHKVKVTLWQFCSQSRYCKLPCCQLSLSKQVMSAMPRESYREANASDIWRRNAQHLQQDFGLLGNVRGRCYKSWQRHAPRVVIAGAMALQSQVIDL